MWRPRPAQRKTDVSVTTVIQPNQSEVTRQAGYDLRSQGQKLHSIHECRQTRRPLTVVCFYHWRLTSPSRPIPSDRGLASPPVPATGVCRRFRERATRGPARSPLRPRLTRRYAPASPAVTPSLHSTLDHGDASSALVTWPTVIVMAWVLQSARLNSAAHTVAERHGCYLIMVSRTLRGLKSGPPPF